jgi:hypothetical protein
MTVTLLGESKESASAYSSWLENSGQSTVDSQAQIVFASLIRGSVQSASSQVEEDAAWDSLIESKSDALNALSSRLEEQIAAGEAKLLNMSDL